MINIPSILMSPRTWKLIGIAAIVIAIASTYFYVRHLQGVNEEQRQSIAQYISAAEKSAEVIDQLKRDNKKIVANQKKLRGLVVKNQRDADNLRRIFNKKTNRLEKIADKKPTLLEKKINKASDKRLECLRKVMGDEQATINPDSCH